tara:strand:+ start:254 stop:508 length:255 start_codon:yes stop_codon:yes gene_type:complete
MAKYTKSGPRMDRWLEKRDEAQERQEQWENLTSVQQLDSLDEQLGRGVGAVKQRARILKNAYKKSKKVKNKRSTNKRKRKNTAQ